MGTGFYVEILNRTEITIDGTVYTGSTDVATFNLGYSDGYVKFAIGSVLSSANSDV